MGVWKYTGPSGRVCHVRQIHCLRLLRKHLKVHEGFLEGEDLSNLHHCFIHLYCDMDSLEKWPFCGVSSSVTVVCSGHPFFSLFSHCIWIPQTGGTFTFFTFSRCDTQPGYHPNVLYTIVGESSEDQVCSGSNRGYCEHREDSHCIWIPKMVMAWRRRMVNASSVQFSSLLSSVRSGTLVPGT